MKQNVVQLEDVAGMQDLILEPELVYKVPDTVWVIDADSKEMLDVKEITVATAAANSRIVCFRLLGMMTPPDFMLRIHGNRNWSEVCHPAG